MIARRGGRLVFCEVKSKNGVGRGDPLEMVDAEKQRRLRRAAEAWLASHPQYGAFEARFDVVAVRGRELEHVVNAF